MKIMTGTVLAVVFTAFFSLLLSAVAPSAALAYDEENRTVNRTVLGRIIVPDRFFNKPEHYEFTPLVSNQDPQNQHPAAWDGQDWDVSKWEKGWTADSALQKFFKARIFERQYMNGDKMPVVELGPTFYKLSDLDQRRTLKLLTERMAIFKKGYNVVGLADWSTHDMVGTYTPKGMFLN